MTVPFLDLAAMQAEIGAELDRAWHEVTRSGQFIGGAFVERFEAEWAAYCGARHCVGVANGTAALQLTLAALGVGPGDDVIVPANTFIATAEAVAAVGARPVFIDVDPATLLMTAAGARAALTPRTAAVVAVHLYGQPVDMDALRAVTAPRSMPWWRTPRRRTARPGAAGGPAASPTPAASASTRARTSAPSVTPARW